MIKIPIHITVVLLVLIFAECTGGPGGAKNERLFRSIEFQGLVYMSKYDIIKKVRAATTGKGILVDMDSLKSILGGLPMIEDYTISTKGDRLIVRVKEKIPSFPVAVTDGATTLLLEFDENYSLISKGKIYSEDSPLTLIGREDIRSGVLSERVRRLHELCAWTKGAFPSLYRELSELSPGPSDLIRVKLKGRRTEMNMKAGKGNIRRLNYITGYLDRIKYYPEKLDINGNMIVIR
ncbi:MAG: hypothetical protein CVV44_14720 [Spirochaetae bacterium HGW-Spirochaetae-1]|jgi:hypothetical protein|nr:MAG: hypothetical protein CVV44_14720 [Spirochaetae bacterium HGW-Spirochaetae-1]